MRYTNELVEKALTLPSVQGKGHLARRMEMGHSQLNAVLKGTRNLTERQAWLLAEILDRSPLDVLCLVGMDKARTDDERDWWRRRAPRFVATTIGAAIVAGMMNLAPVTPAYTAGLVQQSIHYAKYVMARVVEALTRLGTLPTVFPEGLARVV